MDGLEAVAGVGEGAPDDDRHRVVEIGAAHLLFDIDGDEVGAAGRQAAIERELGVLIVCHRGFRSAQKGGETLPERRRAGILRTVGLFYAPEGGFSKA